MFKGIQLRYVVILLFLIFFTVFYLVSLGSEFDSVFLTIATFTFAIFTGFFISRQGTRQASVRSKMADFDGILSFIYRAFGHFSEESQQKIGGMLKKHYTERLKDANWAHYFTKKSTLLIDMHAEIDAIMESDVAKVKNQAVNRVMSGLSDAQKIRKGLVSLYEERIPVAQWLLIILLTLILLVTVSLLPSQHQVLASTLKAAFSTAVVFVLIILAKFDKLSFFEKTVGEHSARDVLEILEGNK